MALGSPEWTRTFWPLCSVHQSCNCSVNAYVAGKWGEGRNGHWVLAVSESEVWGNLGCRFCVAGRKTAAQLVPICFCSRNFVNTFIQFKKPIVVAVNGPAIGLGASILPLCDVVWANEKAWFQTPYTTFGQSPDGCSTVMFPRIMGGASVSLVPAASPGLLSHPMAFQPHPVLSVTPPVLPLLS